MPSAVAISSYPGAVPISTLPAVLEAGVIEVIVLNRPCDTTVLPEFGPEIVSVLLNPSVPVPTIVKEFSLSLPVEVIDILVPKDEPKAGSVPTLIPVAAPSEEIFVIFVNNLVPLTVLLFTPVIVSVWSLPSKSLPVIVKVTDSLFEEL